MKAVVSKIINTGRVGSEGDTLECPFNANEVGKFISDVEFMIKGVK